MQGSFSEESLEVFNKLASATQDLDYSESGADPYDFTRCVRPDGSAYGTRGRCKKGTEADKPAESSSSSTPKGEGSKNTPSKAKRNFSLKPLEKVEPLEGTDVNGKKWRVLGINLAVHDPKTGKRLGTIQTSITRFAGMKPDYEHILRTQYAKGKYKSYRLPSIKSPLEALNKLLSKPRANPVFRPDAPEYEPWEGI
jgi:hypothetical protein